MTQSARLKRNLSLHLMILPGLLIIALYRYVPMGGIVIALVYAAGAGEAEMPA